MSSSPPISVKKTKDAIPGRYIVTFKGSVDHDIGVSSVTDRIDSQSNVTHKWGFINGLAGAFTNADLELLRSNPHVASIEEDGHVHTQVPASRNDGTWGLGRISSVFIPPGSDPNALTYTYKYDDSAGAGTDVYIIACLQETDPWIFGQLDTDQISQHTALKVFLLITRPSEISQGRATWGKTFISGMDWVATTAPATGRPSVASMSLAGGRVETVNLAANHLVAAGVTTVVAAANNNDDATKYSPASASDVITVGASDINDAKASFSNFGTPLAIWAPGVNVISTWNNGGRNTLSGTSMATPHVAGVCAYLLGTDPTLTPKEIKKTIRVMALKGVLSSIPPGTTNRLLNNGL
ncbi:subtilisin-like protein [Thelephora ganbajun]|uniref:Subtilisin-like protein n=1 Tax=Thelephora ganbajun TaxID=370292 RepID=A0ACB6ZFI3_THEGA|nr:subtilisin-like protein [Thelephora ganbajun]